VTKGGVKNIGKNLMNVVKEHVLPDKNSVALPPASPKPIKTWLSWSKLIEAMYLARLAGDSEGAVKDFFQRCTPTSKPQGSADKRCAFFQNRPSPMQLRKFYDEGDFEKHSGVEVFVATNTDGTKDFDVALDLADNAAPRDFAAEAEVEAAAARRAASAAAIYAKKAAEAAARTITPPTTTTTTERSNEIWVSFRGSNNKKDTIADIKAILKPWPYNSKIGEVHMGFLQQYSQVRESIKQDVLQLISAGYKTLHFTGHSLGGALAELAAMDAAEYTQGTGLTTLTLMSFGAPDPADEAWVANYNKRIKLSTRVVYESDLVPCVPGGWQPAAKLTSVVNGLKGLFSGKANFSKKFKQVRSLLMFMRGKWRSIQWPKCNFYKQSLDDHRRGLYIDALRNYPLTDSMVTPLK